MVDVEPPVPAAAPTAPAGRGVLEETLAYREALIWLLVGFAGYMLGTLLSVALVTLLAALLGHSAELSALSRAAEPPSWYIAGSLVGLWVGFLGAPLVAARLAGPVRRRLGVAFRPIDLLGIPLGIGLQLLIGLLYSPFLRHVHNFDAPIKRLAGGSHGAAFALIVLGTVLVAPIAEELFFRGLLLRSLLGITSPLAAVGRWLWLGLAVLLDGAVFGLSHGEMLQLPGLMLVGVVLSVAFLRTGRLGMPILTHMSFNAVAMASFVGASGLVQAWH